MRVLHLTRDFPPRSSGGVSTAVGGLARAQRRRGLDLAVISFDAWRPRAGAAAAGPAVRDRWGGLEVLRVSAPPQLGDAHAFADAAAPDLVHVHADLLWPVADEMRARLRIPAVVTAHVAQAEQDRLRGLAAPTQSARAQARALADADAVLAPSRAARDALVAAHGADRARARIARLGTDDSAPARAAVTTRRAGGPIVNAGRFADVNGTGDLLEAIPRVLARAPGARFVIAGGCPDSPRSDRRWRRRFDRELPAPARARVELAGWLDAGALSALYSEASALVIPSWFETFGLVAVEGMIHGAPIAAARAGALDEILAHGDTALLSPPRDVNALAAHVADLALDPDRAHRLGAAAAAGARAHHLWDDVVGDHLACYRDLAGAARS